MKHDDHHRHIERRLRELERHNGGHFDDSQGFIYQVNIAQLAAGASQTVPIQIDALSDFDLEQLTGYVEAAAAVFPQGGDLQPQLTLQITDGAKNQALFASELPWAAVIGTAKLPFVLPKPRRLVANQAVNVTFRNFSAVAYNNLFLALIGAKVFPRNHRD